MNPYMSYTPYMPQDAYMQDQMALRQRIDNLSQAQQQYKAQPQPNVNWIQVAGIDGARNQIVQPGTTAWMMDNNAPSLIQIRMCLTQLVRHRETY